MKPVLAVALSSFLALLIATVVYLYSPPGESLKGLKQANFREQEKSVVKRERVSSADDASPKTESTADTSAAVKRECLKRTFAQGARPVERKVFSQYGEDGIIKAIFNCIGVQDKYYVEFGTESCDECTTHHLRDQNWTGLLMDGNHENQAINLHKEFFTAEGIVDLFKKYNVPMRFDHFTIDIDMNTFWVLQPILQAGYRPRSLTIEYNRNFGAGASFAVEYNATQVWGPDDGYTCFFGASATAFHRLLVPFGYTIVASDSIGVNLFAVRLDEVGEPPLALQEVMSAVQQCWSIHNPCTGRGWLEIPEGLAITKPQAEWYPKLQRWTLGHNDQGSKRRFNGKPDGDGKGANYSIGTLDISQRCL